MKKNIQYLFLLFIITLSISMYSCKSETALKGLKIYNISGVQTNTDYGRKMINEFKNWHESMDMKRATDSVINESYCYELLYNKTHDTLLFVVHIIHSDKNAEEIGTLISKQIINRSSSSNLFSNCDVSIGYKRGKHGEELKITNQWRKEMWELIVQNAFNTNIYNECFLDKYYIEKILFDNKDIKIN